MTLQAVCDIVGVGGLVVLLWGAFSMGLEIGAMVCGAMVLGWSVYSTLERSDHRRIG